MELRVTIASKMDGNVLVAPSVLVIAVADVENTAGAHQPEQWSVLALDCVAPRQSEELLRIQLLYRETPAMVVLRVEAEDRFFFWPWVQVR